jgi:hypothetical protein
MSEGVNVRPPLISKRTAALVLPALLALSGTAGGATDAGASVRFTSAPQRAVQGSLVTFGVAVSPRGARCTLTVRYANGARQKGLRPQRAAGGNATWRFRLSRRTGTGAATATVSCAGAGSMSHSMLVVGSVIPAKITVAKKGFSVRVHPYGGSTVSYGVILQNHSPSRDALDVSVLVNFVLPDNRLVGTATTSISEIDAGTQYAHGSDISFVGVPPIERLEVVVQVGKQEPGSRRKPAVSNVRVVPDPYNPSWVGSVEGELVNDDRRVLERAWLSTVLFDEAGNVLGGGNGYAFSSLPPAARQFFKLTSGLGAVAFERAASAMVSVAPTYRS